MPMIKIAPPTLKIEPSFKDAVLTMYKIYMENINIRSGGNAERKKELLQNNMEASVRALDAINGVSEARRGLSYEWMRFNIASEYTRLYTTEYRGATWLVGDTKPVEIGKWKIGCYAVCFRIDHLVNGKLHGQHFIPMASPLAEVRHPHHFADVTTASQTSKNPLDMNEHTCWGGFGQGIVYAVRELDIPGLYSMMYKYLCRYNPNSILGGRGHAVEQTQWMKKESERRSPSTSRP